MRLALVACQLWGNFKAKPSIILSRFGRTRDLTPSILALKVLFRMLPSNFPRFATIAQPIPNLLHDGIRTESGGVNRMISLAACVNHPYVVVTTAKKI